jgi:hypothetical protein
MNTNYMKINFHSFVDDKLAEKSFKIVLITKELMEKRVDDFMNFVNGIRSEYKDVYDWKKEPKEYFLNEMVDKWKYSFAVLNQKDKICFVNFSSVYGNKIHYHFAYAGKDIRNFNLSKLHIIKLCQVCIENGFSEFEAYWPKNNNKSIILYLKMGWEIQDIRNNKEIFMTANIEKVRNQTYELLISEKK